jgi:hypothetical protein
VGPPKTGSSVIQHWLCVNSDLLLKQGVYYPTHSFDVNGVSSGNVLSLFDRDSNQTLHFNSNKKQKLLQKTVELGAKTLILSSEFFFSQMDFLLEEFPDAKIIAYIRFPLEDIESSYNQSVKRHYQVRPFGLGTTPAATAITKLSNVINSFGENRFVLRCFSPTFFIGQDLVNDLLIVIGFKSDKSIKSSRVNESYCFEAMEFKRWLNQFDIAPIHTKVDNFLQQYEHGQRRFSLLNNERYDFYRKYFVEKLTLFFDQVKVENSDLFLKELENKKSKPYIKQEIDIDSFVKVFNALVVYDKKLASQIANILLREKHLSIRRREFLDYIMAQQSLYFRGVNRCKALLWNVRQYIAFTFKFWFFRTFRNQKVIADVERLREQLKIPQSTDSAAIYRELALFCEQNGELYKALLLMERAKVLKPNGQFIVEKVDEYSKQLKLKNIR